MQPTKLPTRADDPPRVLLWSIDEMLPIFAGLVVGMLIDRLILCLIAGFIVTHIYRKFRDLHPDGFMVHFAYFYGFYFGKAKSMVNPYIRRFFP